ncbi:MAG: ATP-binding protein, partial [Planctomycetota bacterium]
HLAGHGDKAKAWKGVDGVLKQAGVPSVPTAATAVFVGTEFDVIQGRGGDGEPVRKTPWGELAWQLGGQQAFSAVAEHDKRGIAPGGDVIRQMLPDRPALILMDELMNYVSRGRKMGLRDQLFDFLQNLSEEARARNNLAMCVSIPGSELEMNPEDQRDHESLKKLLDRLGKAIIMSADVEIAEIIRRRLFEWYGMPDEGRKAVRAYSEWAIENAAALTGIDADTAHERYQASYPFHPSVLSVFERKWQSLPRFQRTRGVLRLLALWVAHSYQEEHRKAAKEPLITLGSAPLEDSTFRAAMFEQLGSDELEVPVTTDIAGRKDAHAVRLDKEAPEAVRKAKLHRKVASAIFFESNGGMSRSKAEATLPEIKTGVGDPDLNLADVDSVLEGLVGTCFYLNWDRNRYRFGLTPNLNQILVVRRGAVQEKAIEERVKSDTEKLFNEGSKEIDRRFWPKRSNDVPSRPVLTLVVLGLDTPAGAPATTQLMESIVRECGTSGRTYKSALIFTAPDSAESIREAARTCLAWEDIDDDTDTVGQLDEAQKRLLARNLGRAKSDLKESIWRSYRRLYLLGKDNTLREIDLGQITSSTAANVVELYLRELGRTDEVVPGVGPSKLVKYWPPALSEWSTKSVRDAFYSSPQLPRLLQADAIRRTIADGVTQGILGYAGKDSQGKLVLEQFNESLGETEVEVGDEVFLLRAEDAKKLLEPPRLPRLAIRPEHTVVKLGEQVSLDCRGEDQYGQPFDVPPLEWSATGGAVTSGGLFTAGDNAGQFTVRATAAGMEAIAEVRVTEKEISRPPTPTGQRVIRWTGGVPSQKWMNFYTKVLSRFVSSPDLNLTVTFEVPADDDQAQAKADEARMGLKELDLSDDVEVC